MLNWLKDFVLPIVVSDAQFGTARYLRESRTWEAWLDFAPVGHPIEVLLSGDPEGIAGLHRQFIREVETQYAKMQPQVSALLNKTIELHELGEGLHPKLVAIDLPVRPDIERWELCFETEPRLAFLAVQMEGFTPVDVYVEC